MNAPRMSAALLGLGVLGLVLAVLLGPGVPGSYCIYGGIAAIILAGAVFVVHVLVSLFQEYMAS